VNGFSFKVTFEPANVFVLLFSVFDGVVLTFSGILLLRSEFPLVLVEVGRFNPFEFSGTITVRFGTLLLLFPAALEPYTPAKFLTLMLRSYSMSKKMQDNLKKMLIRVESAPKNRGKSASFAAVIFLQSLRGIPDVRRKTPGRR
jgi:hypothetical protein